MRKTKLVSLVLTVMTVSALAAVPAMASTQLKSSTLYKTDNTQAADWLELELKGVGTIKKNTRVYDIYSSNKKVIDPAFVKYKVEKTTAAIKYIGKVTTDSEYTIPQGIKILGAMAFSKPGIVMPKPLRKRNGFPAEVSS